MSDQMRQFLPACYDWVYDDTLREPDKIAQNRRSARLIFYVDRIAYQSE